MTKREARLCIIYNFAQRYREGIYRLIESQYDCHWVFGNNETDIKGLDYSMFRSVQEVRNRYVIGHVSYQQGVPSLVRKYDTFLVLGELYWISTWMLLFQCKFIYRKKKVYLWSHGWYGREGLVKRILKKWFFGMADAVLLYGEYAREVARKQGYTKDNLYVIHNSLDYERQVELRGQMVPSSFYATHFGNTHPVLLFIGRLTKTKRLDMLLDVLSKSARKFNLVLVGDGEDREALRHRMVELGLEGRVWFYGACYEEAENARLIYYADLCVSPGNVGLTAMHSMVYGTPVISHDRFSYQMPEFEAIRPGRTGAFFRYNDVESLTSVIEQWFASPTYNREQIRQACYEEIDTRWTPKYQMGIINEVLK